MKRTGTVLMLITLLLPVMLMSVEYNLNNYQEPDNFNHGLYFHLSNDGSIYTRNDVENSNQNADLFVNYFARQYSRNNILDIFFTSELRYDNLSSTTKDSLHIERDAPQFNSYFMIDAELRHYLYNDWFINIEAFCYAHNSLSDSDTKKIEYHSTDYRESYSYSESGVIGLGYGRVENVSKAYQAREILSELEKAGLLARAVNKEDIESLADRLVQLTTLRLFNYRLINMEKVRQINRELIAQGLLSGDEIESFVIIMDLYNMGSVFIRKSGWDIYPEFIIDNSDGYSETCYEKVYSDTIYNDYTRNSECNNGLRSYQPGLSFHYYQVLSSKWQLEASGSYGYFWSEEDSKYTNIYHYETHSDSFWETREYDIEGYRVGLNLELSWYPDTRTKFWSSIDYDISDSDNDITYQNLDETDNYTKSYSEFERVYYISTGIDYYFSPKLYFQFKSTYGDDNGGSIFDYKDRFTYKMSVLYYLF
ncbi:MAG: hypothetical protein RAO94_03600 [Candidatus Stygibacter australis]|nr:hypothetical protein [Candidatus Stygibacter australis]MDP8321418.1 hypothetical protein [Candidatus Stygibacter australis]